MCPCLLGTTARVWEGPIPPFPSPGDVRDPLRAVTSNSPSALWVGESTRTCGALPAPRAGAAGAAASPGAERGQRSLCSAGAGTASNPPQTGQGNARNGHGNPHGKLRSGFTTERRSKNRSEGAAAAEAIPGKRGSGIPAASRRDGTRARLLGEHLPDFFMCLAPGRCQMRELRAGHGERGVAALPARPWHPEQPQGREDARKGLCDFGGVLAAHGRSKPLCPGGFCLGEILGYIEFARFNPEF